MRKKINQSNVLLFIVFILIFIYTSNDLATGSTSYNFSGVSRTSSHIWLALSIIFIGLAGILLPSGKHSNALISPLIIMACWIIINSVIYDTPLWTSVTYAGFVMWWVLVMIFARRYVYSVKGDLSVLIGLASMMLAYYMYKFFMVYRYAGTLNRDNPAVLNIAFRIIIFLPFILMLDNKKIRNLFLALVGLAVLFSFKRTAIGAYIAMVAGYLYVDARVNKKSLKFVGYIVIFSIIFAVSIHIVDEYSGGFLSSRFVFDNMVKASGRTDRWISAFNDIYNRGMIQLLIGTGINSAGYSQHNEWIEQLYSFGLIGFCIYFVFAVRLFKRFWLYYRKNSETAASYMTIIMYFLIVGFFSGFMFSHSSFYLFLFIGAAQSLDQLSSLQRG